mmetsp:Transcript_1741/g.2221  ORF Transcript_1741/g.2221 Transcript_1741/m.2221 type:complete len:202 (-) Transcript_1741:1100-1705(-)|eukprot:CAMPEP_0204833082 /NCGR_PEP_ID=MMETSP1346-20131115/15635_1 /ASSEMBLY_ACC=CAM_ASM_000771 /TAXON_ID=215587 /ORGANISM="Aplanochytrium stocchinoi, Strain GSBS06" /LENGTH=201 /DNA_ID=CAMNT_0051965343 /DNA_START=86 /DNA_END=691 /DNA_ORIENTATION=+
MVKHNNVLPNGHFKKHWQFRVKVFLDQPGRKLKRRLARKAKAERVAPRPVAGLLRPAVRCPTQRYNTKIKYGRGFTLQELKEAGINAKQALSIGIAVDHRRKNRSVQGLQANVERLKSYKARLVVFPRKGGKVKKGDSTVDETSAATQLKGEILPIAQPKSVLETMAITEDMKKGSAVKQYKQARATQYITGKRRWAKKEE